MGSNDIPPAHAPAFLIPLSTAVLMTGVLFWDVTYILMTLRGLRTRSYGMPLLALATNVSWEMVYGFYVAESLIDRLGFGFWLVLDLGLIYCTVSFAPLEWRRTSPRVGRHMGWILGLMTAVGLWGHAAFMLWFMEVPHRGSGDKTGKWWRSRDGFDTTECAFWAAAVSQLMLSGGSVAMLLARGHSGGTSYKIWFVRTLGSIFGMEGTHVLLWWYWPEAHGFVVTPLAIFLCGIALSCDLVYPFLLREVRKTEKTLPDGRLVSAEAYAEELREYRKVR